MNRDNIPGPFGHAWGPSTIYGNWRRGTGILNNDLYSGRLVWNRQRFVKDPTTGKRQARLNPRDEWIIEDVPGLAILGKDLWDDVKARQAKLRARLRLAEGASRPERARRPAYLLSGLLNCGACGSGFSKISQHHYGCSAARDRGTCHNHLTIRRDIVEGTVVEGLRRELMDPALFKEFAEEYVREINRRRADEDRASELCREEAARIDRQIVEIIEAIKDGLRTAAMKGELERLEARKAELATQATVAPKPRLHPNLAELYRAKVADLQRELTRPEVCAEAADIFHRRASGARKRAPADRA